ncbi:MAG: rnr [Gammaproteobacteria bacterium]|jgi:ribonuclease R|nr:rnr [Gammaproteobacteria bacterium]
MKPKKPAKHREMSPKSDKSPKAQKKSPSTIKKGKEEKAKRVQKSTKTKKAAKKSAKNWLAQHDPFANREAQKYESPIPSREHILDYLQQQDKPIVFKPLAAALNLNTPEQLDALSRRLRAMERDGQLLQNRKGQYCIIDKLDLIRGRVIGHRDGYGFFSPEEGGDDLFLNARQMQQVLHNDEVLVRASRMNQRGRQEATIVEVLSHNTQSVVGRYYEEGGVGFVEPSHQQITQDVMIAQSSVLKPAPGQIVVAKIIKQPTFRHQPLGEITEILKRDLAVDLTIDVAIRSYHLPFEWEAAALEEAQHLGEEVAERDKTSREDLRHLPLVTIDGIDAKDFDDAVYCEPLPKGGWRLIVAIADVSFYVKPDSALDKEAQLRGNSVYFPRRVLPMLPESLSNGLCSLKSNVDRLCLVCDMTITAQGKLTQSRFYHGIMQSQARFTYEEVTALLNNERSAHTKRYAALLPHLNHLHSLYLALLSSRNKRGAIDFHFVESYFEFDEKGQIAAIKPRERTVAHRIIEECMLAANVSTARFLIEHEIPALFRIHPAPGEDKLTQLRDFLKPLGLDLKGGSKPEPLHYAKLLETVMTRTDAALIQMVILRSLSQAVYGAENQGHFALSYEAYGHFTSPIRRYPDLIVHRAISHLVSQSKSKKQTFSYTPAMMSRLGEHCSMTERRADEATRSVGDWLKCEFMRDKVGNVYSGMVTSVTGFGLFVQLDEIFIDGLVHITALPEDYYQFDPVQHCLIGRRFQKRYCLGDKLKVSVSRVNVDAKQIDLDIVE